MKYLVVANWKCNPATLSEAKKLFDSVGKGAKNIKNAEVVICPPFVYLPDIRHTKYNIRLGAQDCFWEEKGAFTGEISPKMLKNLGVEYVIIGHSERRRYLNETDKMVNKKLKLVLSLGLKPILCIENLNQLKKDLKGMGISKKVIVAYEPVFAIGTGKPCGVVMAKKMRSSINQPRVLYGGSVNSQNAKDYIKKGKFQGLLVGGASLNPTEFVALVKEVDLISKI